MAKTTLKERLLKKIDERIKKLHIMYIDANHHDDIVGADCLALSIKELFRFSKVIQRSRN